MSLARRLTLLAWAARAGAWVLEDDFDSEFRYAGRPVAAMQGLDAAGRVVYLGTFSKTMFPALRAGYLVVPAALVDAFTVAVRLTGHQVAADLQAALADFIVDGHFAAHVRRMRALYASRQDRLVRALRRRLDGILAVDSRDGGMQVAGMLAAGADDVAASLAASCRGRDRAAALALSRERSRPARAPPRLRGRPGTRDHRGRRCGSPARSSAGAARVAWRRRAMLRSGPR